MNLEIPIIGILRGVEEPFVGDVLAASFRAGLQAVEVTINTENAERIVAGHRPEVPAGKLLGMGTIRNLAEARRALAAGAMFLVTPNLDLEVVAFARQNGIPIVAGALTPTEVYQAWQAGADLIKVFPCGSLGGPRYIRELLGPFDRCPLAAVGGVTPDNLQEYLKAGAAAVGMGTSLFGREALAAKNTETVAARVQKCVEQCRPMG